MAEGKIKLKNLSDLLEIRKTVKNVSPRTRLRAKQERELQVQIKQSQEVEKENYVKKRGKKLRRTSLETSSSVEFVLETPVVKAKQNLKVKAKTTIKRGKVPADQKLIDTYFYSCSKTYGMVTTDKKRKVETAASKPKRGRKRLFVENSKDTAISKKLQSVEPMEVIDLCLQSDTEDEQADDLKDFDLKSTSMLRMTNISEKPEQAELHDLKSRLKKTNVSKSIKIKVCKQKENMEKIKAKDDRSSLEQKSTSSSDSTVGKPPKPCPPYKIIDDTTFAVDAFRYGNIVGVNNYFLTHFHADHYTGLTRKFAMPLYMSDLTARLVREFIGVDEQFIHILPLNETVLVSNVEVTALEANHCPGAIIILFKLESGRCLLHTGDFRACPDMESEPIFWNNNVDTIYLDTTYLPTQYLFCTQTDSIQRGKYMVEEFRKRNAAKRILYVCGSYVIGKEKFWGALAQEFRLKVWTDANRRKALNVMKLEELKNIQFVEDAEDADMHILPLGKLSYPILSEYFEDFSERFDVMLALRPSGWEKNSQPRFSGVISVVGVEYSEHSSYSELERFVKFLKPRVVVSTVPVGYNLYETSTVPARWYQYNKLQPMPRNYQPTISNYMAITKSKGMCDQKKLAKAQFVEKSEKQGRSQNISPTKSTPMKCLGTPPENLDIMDSKGDADALDDWMN